MAIMSFISSYFIFVVETTPDFELDAPPINYSRAYFLAFMIIALGFVFIISSIYFYLKREQN
jgi:hypothetical protein